MKTKHVMITGASSGLGEALAKKFAQQGYNLTLTARREDRLHKLRDELLSLHPSVGIMVAAADVADKLSMKQVIDEGVKQFSQIDIFVANAGLGMWSRFRDVDDPEQLHNLMHVNYMGVVYGLFYALPHLRASLGSFVAVSSIQGTIPVIFHTGYVASKYAVNGLIETIRLEEPDVHFLLALPSWISGTELRSHAVSGTGDHAVSVKRHHGKSAVPADECARLIIDALMAKKSTIFIPKKYAVIPLLRDLFKGPFDRFVMRKVKGQLRSLDK